MITEVIRASNNTRYVNASGVSNCRDGVVNTILDDNRDVSCGEKEMLLEFGLGSLSDML